LLIAGGAMFVDLRLDYRFRPAALDAGYADQKPLNVLTVNVVIAFNGSDMEVTASATEESAVLHNTLRICHSRYLNETDFYIGNLFLSNRHLSIHIAL
jgi:hypothetical protein